MNMFHMNKAHLVLCKAYELFTNHFRTTLNETTMLAMHRDKCFRKWIIFRSSAIACKNRALNLNFSHPLPPPPDRCTPHNELYNVQVSPVQV